MTIRELNAEMNRICAHLLHTPRKNRMNVLRGELAKLPGEHERSLTLLLVSTTVDLNDDPSAMKTWEKITLMGSGFAIIVTMLTIAIFIPNPQPFQVFMFRSILGLAGAAFSCALPGVLNIEGKLAAWSIRAGGSLGVFVLIYSVNPPAIESKGMDQQGNKPAISTSGSSNNYAVGNR